MLSYIIATIRDTNVILGYRVLTIAKGKPECNDIPKDRFLALCSQRDIKFQNAVYDASKNDIVGSGTSINNLPLIASNGVLRGLGGITLLYSIIKDKKVMGYGIADSYGMVVNVRLKKLLELSNSYKNVNFDVYTKKDGTLGVRLKSGELPKVDVAKFANIRSYNSNVDSAQEVDAIKKSNMTARLELEASMSNNLVLQPHQNNLSSEIKSSGSDNILPGLHVYNLNDISNGEFNTNCQDKLYILSVNLTALTPYYSLMYQSIPKEPNTAVPTMGVTEDKLYYNAGFVSSLSVPELTFVVIHEMLHIAMQHSARHGKKNNYLWNIACDLFINELIMRDFGCKFGGDVVSTDVTIDGRTRTATIQTPSFGVFLATIGESLDFATDTPETIYNRLVAENPSLANSPQNSNLQGSGGSGQGSGGSDSGSGQGSDENGSGDGQGSGGSDADSDSQDSSKDNQNSDGNGSGNDDSESNPFSNENKSNSQSSTINVEIIDSDNGEYNKQLVNVEVKYNGKTIKGCIPMDVFSNNELRISDEDTNRAIDESQMALQRIVTKRKMAESEGKSCSLTSSSEVCERYIRFGLSAKYNWVQILKNVAKVDPKKMYTLAQPNKQYMMRGITLAARREIGKPDKLKGIKFAMDVSGSVGQTEIDSTFTKISEILNLYKIEAELIYWDTTVNSVGNFNDLKSLYKIKPLGCGGTDLTCVFDYLMGKTRCNGVSEETKLRDISVVMIFTDGAFYLRNAEYYKKYFANKVVFVANDGCPPFDIPFGKLAIKQN